MMDDKARGSRSPIVSAEGAERPRLAQENTGARLKRAFAEEEEERKWIARELLAGTAQSLTCILLGLGTIESCTEIAPERKAVRRLGAIALAALERVQHLVYGLQQPRSSVDQARSILQIPDPDL